MEIQATIYLLEEMYQELCTWLGTVLAVLGKCRECGKEVSSTADVCPHCGCKKPYRGPEGAFGCLVLIAVVVFIIIVYSQNH